MNRLISKQCLLYIAFSLLSLGHLIAQAPVAPSLSELNQPFDEGDKKTFSHPPKVFYPETCSTTSGVTYPSKVLLLTWKRLRMPDSPGYICFTDSSAGPGRGSTRK